MLPHSVFLGAVVVAGTGQDHHDWPPGAFTVGTLELHQRGLRSVGRAAAAVYTGATVARLVGLDAGAVLVREVDGFIAPHHPLALTASLQGEKDALNVCYSIKNRTYDATCLALKP